MNTKNSILLISDDKEFLTTAEQKLIFLRNSDAVVCSDYKNAEINVELSLLIDFLKKHDKISFNEFVELSRK